MAKTTAKLKREAFFDYSNIQYQFTDIAEKAKELSKEDKKLLYYFLDGQVDNIANLPKDLSKLGTEARELIKNTGFKIKREYPIVRGLYSGSCSGITLVLNKNLDE